jgi:hypothetical protein
MYIIKSTYTSKIYSNFIFRYLKAERERERERERDGRIKE